MPSHLPTDARPRRPFRRIAVAVMQDGSTEVTARFYAADWQVLERRAAGETTARHVWSPMYVDALILTDRDTGATPGLDSRAWLAHDANFKGGKGTGSRSCRLPPTPTTPRACSALSPAAVGLRGWQGRPTRRT
jgi:hypothetical protein